MSISGLDMEGEGGGQYCQILEAAIFGIILSLNGLMFSYFMKPLSSSPPDNVITTCCLVIFIVRVGGFYRWNSQIPYCMICNDRNLLSGSPHCVKTLAVNKGNQLLMTIILEGGA